MLELTERQKQIVNAAIEIISEGGLQKFSIRELANRVGISEPAIYRHFKDKADIMMNVGLFMKTNWQEATKWTEKLPGIEAIEQFHRGGIEFFSKNPDVAAALYSLRTSPNYTHLLEEVASDNHVLRIFGEFIKRGQNEGTIRSDIPSEQLAAIIEGTMVGLVEKWNLSGQGFDLVAEWEPIWKALKKMITPPE